MKGLLEEIKKIICTLNPYLNVKYLNFKKKYVKIRDKTVKLFNSLRAVPIAEKP